MSSPNSYVWGKMYVAINCLCREGSFKKRLYWATISALIGLEDDDLPGDLAEDLKYILDWTKRNLADEPLESVQREPNEGEQEQLIEKMLRILTQTQAN